MIEFSYQTCVRTERIGGVPLEIEALADLDRTIDDLFDALQASGRPELLETLCPYFGAIWPSARGLADQLAGAVDALRGRTLLEVGCGLAVPSLVASKLGAQVTATDTHPEVERFLARNLARNGHPPVAYRRLDWLAEEPAVPAERLGRFDWVVGSDILYERAFIPRVARAIERHLAPGGVAVVADPGRPYLQAFADEMKGLGFDAETQARGEIFVLVFEKGRGA